MKPLTISLFLFFPCSVCYSQSAAKIPDPSYVNHVYSLMGDSLISLEHVDAHYMMKPPVPFGKNEAGLSMPSEKSPTRIKQADTLKFVIKLASSMIDPSQMLKLYSLRSKKGNREAVLSSSQDQYYKTKTEDNTGGLKFNVQKSGTDVYVMVPASRLASGEYAFMNSMLVGGGGPHTTYTLYAFGIDP
jgi:hypothetical protein